MALPAIDGELDLAGWRAWLRQRLDAEWRAGEWDTATWLFTGDPANPATNCRVCAVRACTTVTDGARLCFACDKDWRSVDLTEQVFIDTHEPSVFKHYMGVAEPICLVQRDGVRCGRAAHTGARGLCMSHGGRWRAQGRPMPVDEWARSRTRPLPALAQCVVLGCPRQRRASFPACFLHHQRWVTERRAGRVRDGQYEQWAVRQLPYLGAHQFSLAALSDTARLEVRYGLQRRDALGRPIDLPAVRALVRVLAEADTLTAIRATDIGSRFRSMGTARAHATDILRAVHAAHDEHRGVDPTHRPVWDLIAVGIPSAFDRNRPRTNNARAEVDFTPIQQGWLRELTMAWARTVRPNSTRLKQTVWAATVASRTLALRPGGGTDTSVLRFADMTAVVDGFRRADSPTGRAYRDKNRAALLSLFLAVLDFGRSNEMLPGLSAGFGRHPDLRITVAEDNEDEIGKAIPEPVIAQLDTHIDLFGGTCSYGDWAQDDIQAMFHTVYVVLRDTGRRPREVCALPLDCLEIEGGEYSLIYHNYKKQRLRRRLPITVATAGEIQTWQHRRAGLRLPETTRGWLFPAMTDRASRGHLATNKLTSVTRGWIDAIPALHGDLPGPDGTPLPFDRSLIFPKAFRFSYAQRHADAGVPVEVLKELMDHRDISTTQRYYSVSLKRKREAIKVMGRYVRDRTGAPAAAGSVAAYELKSVSVPFGNCREPSNVKAGGKACPIRFQCAGCGFYRPDPSYLPAIEDHVTALKADRETATAMDVDAFVVRNLDEQITAFGQVAATMRHTLDALPAAERAEVEQASRILRKARAAGGRTQLPIVTLSQGRQP